MRDDFVELAVRIVCSYVSSNALPVGNLPAFISSTHASLLQRGAHAVAREEPVHKQKPAVSIKKSITADFIICLEDGRNFKTLKRHLANTYGLTPAQYRAKWQLPSTYPMVAPNYAAARAAHARSIGLGQHRKKLEAAIQVPEIVNEQIEQVVDPTATLVAAVKDEPPFNML